MKVTVEELPEVPVGTKGILIRVRNQQGENLGKLRIGSGRVRWARGSVSESNAKSMTVQAFVDYLNKIP